VSRLNYYQFKTQQMANMKRARGHVKVDCTHLERGASREARAELDAITPEDGASLRTLVLRISAHMDLEEWESMRRAACQLATVYPEDPRWRLCVAYATRRLESLEQAKTILVKAEAHFPTDSSIKYNLSCLAAQLGELPAAKEYLRTAIELNPRWRNTAQQELDLEPLWDSLDDL
jgi:tetratricopeptide (TPR) repeat protein